MCIKPNVSILIFSNFSSIFYSSRLVEHFFHAHNIIVAVLSVHRVRFDYKLLEYRLN